MNRKLMAALLAGVFSTAAGAFEPFTVRDIRVEGIQRTEAGTVFGYLPVKVGDTVSKSQVEEAIRALFATGFFKDVQIEKQDDVLVVVVEERPAISYIDFEGLKEFDKDELKKALGHIGLAESRILDRALLDKAEHELKRQYLSRGKYAATVQTTVTPLGRNRVSIRFTVDEGEAARIQQINIVGAKAFSEKKLLKLFQQTTPGWLTWYTKNDQYSKPKLAADLETLRSFYLDQGYLEFAVDSTQVSITPDKQGIYVTINIREGERFIISGIKVAGNVPVPEAEVRKLVKLKPGDHFSRARLNESTRAIADRLGNDGFAFANVSAVPEVDREKRSVAFTLFVDPGRRVYVRRINVGGNVRTRDEVIRREFRQMEGAWYDAQAVGKSRDRVDKLGYFDEVTVETPAVPGTTDQVDVNLGIKEKPTGNIMLGAGFSDTEKLTLAGSVTQENVFGTGKTISVSLDTSKVKRTLALSYTDPYFTLDGLSLGWDGYYKTVTPSSLSVGKYESKSLGGGIRFAIPVNEVDRINFGFSVDQTEITTFTDSPVRYINFVNRYGATNETILLTAGWGRDTVDSRIYPTRGIIQRAGAEVSTPGGLKYYKATLSHQQFFPLNETFTLMLSGELGLGGGYSGDDLPFYKSYYAGGIRTVRGYDFGGIGPREANGDALGGDTRVVANAELLFPMPGSGIDKSFRLSWFVDAGQVFGPGDYLGRYKDFDAGELRYSTGLGFTWSSPLGPMKFSLGVPLNKKADDRAQRFQFQLGSVF